MIAFLFFCCSANDFTVNPDFRGGYLAFTQVVLTSYDFSPWEILLIPQLKCFYLVENSKPCTSGSDLLHFNYLQIKYNTLSIDQGKFHINYVEERDK